MKVEREAVDALAREVLTLIQRLRPVIEGSPTFWPNACGRLAASLSRELVALLALIRVEDRPAHLASLDRLAHADWDSEWIGGAVRASGAPFRIALTAPVVRHTDGAVYRVCWGLRDISRRPRPD